MFDRIIELVPESWEGFIEFLITPIAWIPNVQGTLIDFFYFSSSGWTTTGKLVFFFFPVLLFIAGIWTTHLSIYTLPFRSQRVKFLSSLLVGWWDAARMVWLYWVGLFRLMGVAIGWVLMLTRLALMFIAEAIKQMLVAPFRMTGKMTRDYFQPGVPWIAFSLLIFWCFLEAVIFTYILFPMVGEILADLTGMEPSRFMGTVLFIFLLMLIMGSFACLNVLFEAVGKKDVKLIIQMVVVELFVMFFEVMFLYRELVDAIVPWIAQQTGERFQVGIVFILSVATFGWIGIRGMTWFLFGQYGTPPLLAFISRRPMVHGDDAPEMVEEPVKQPVWWKGPMEDFKQEIGWLHEKGQEFMEYLALPALHVIAAGFNFVMILLTARPVFSLPFKGLKEIMETREVLTTIQLQPKKVSS